MKLKDQPIGAREKAILKHTKKFATLGELSTLTGYPEASVSSGIRLLRAHGYKIVKRWDVVLHCNFYSISSR